MKRMQPIPRDSNGVAAMLVYINKRTNVDGIPTWWRWRHVHTLHNVTITKFHRLSKRAFSRLLGTYQGPGKYSCDYWKDKEDCDRLEKTSLIRIRVSIVVIVTPFSDAPYKGQTLCCLWYNCCCKYALRITAILKSKCHKKASHQWWL